MAKRITGKYNDSLTDNGVQSAWTSGWRTNRIVLKCDRLLSALLKGEAGIQGLLYLAVGEGEAVWDDSNPDPAETATQLRNELIRYPLAAEQITFLDSVGQPTSAPTHRLQITVEIKGTDFVLTGYQSLREFGLFGGDASVTPNSGYLINYVIHPRIDIIPSATLTREMELNFRSTQSVSTLPRPKPLLQTSTVRNIDGIGAAYVTELENSGITSIDKLVAADQEPPEVSIPKIKYFEMRAKAQLAVTTAGELTPVPGLMDKKARELMETPLPELVAQTGVTEEEIKGLLDHLGSLQVALDSHYFKNATIAELMKTIA